MFFLQFPLLRAQILEQEEIKLIYSLIGDENGAIRQEVAYFIYETLFEGTQAEDTPKKGIPRQLSHPSIPRLTLPTTYN